MNTDSTFDFSRLQDAIVAAARSAWAEVSVRQPYDPIRAFALYSDAGAMTVCPAMAPASYFERIAEDEPDDVDYYRFTPAEWPFEGEGAATAFAEICRTLRMHLKQLPADQFASFKARLIDTCEHSLQILRTEKQGEVGDEFVWLVTISDDEEPADVCVPRTRRLNGNPVAEAFEAWACTWEE